MGDEERSRAHPKRGELLAGKYRVDAVVGGGDAGIVYAAQHEPLGRRVAVKVLHSSIASSRAAVTCFLAEARNASSIQSDRVVQVLDVGILHSGLPYMAMELLDGVDLASRAAAGASLAPVNQAVDWLLETIEAVAHAHAVGVAHGNLKPSNVFLTREPGGTNRVKVLDFGLSAAIGRPGQAASATVCAARGSRAYQSPEQQVDPEQADERADLWALVVVAYELLTGALPFQSSNGAGPDVIPRREPGSPRRVRPEIPAALEAVVLRCLRRDANERFATAAELGLALAPFGTVLSTRALERVIDVSWASAGGHRESSLGPASSPSVPAAIPQSVAPWSSGSGWPRSHVPSAPTAPPIVRARTRATALVATLSVAALAGSGYWIARPGSSAVPPPDPAAAATGAAFAVEAIPAPNGAVDASAPTSVQETPSRSAE